MKKNENRLHHVLLVCFMGAATDAAAMTLDWSLKAKLAAVAEGERDLGTAGGENSQEGILELNPSLLLQFTDQVSAYARIQGFAPTGRVVQTDNNRAVESQGFVALREAWLEYGSIGDYPGQSLRLGLQRLREADALWWDRDIESLRWILDTTLIQAHLGVAQQFQTYRSDDVELPPSQEDRPYIFGSGSTQWTPGHHVGLRAAHAKDRGELQEPGSVPDAEAKSRLRAYTWISARLENGYYEYNREQPISYWAEFIVLDGNREATQVDPLSGTISGTTDTEVSASAADVGLRLRWPRQPAPQVGFAYALGEGGNDSSGQFEQTGLQSNRSRFTGTRTLIHRFNEAVQADLSNLQVTTAYFSMAGIYNDFSLVFNDFMRDNTAAGISASGLDVQPTTTSRDIGQGWDAVFSHYFGSASETYSYGDDARNNLRLRGSLFEPGAAFGENLSRHYRAVLELTLWF